MRDRVERFRTLALVAHGAPAGHPQAASLGNTTSCGDGSGRINHRLYKRPARGPVAQASSLARRVRRGRVERNEGGWTVDPPATMARWEPSWRSSAIPAARAWRVARAQADLFASHICTSQYCIISTLVVKYVVFDFLFTTVVRRSVPFVHVPGLECSGQKRREAVGSRPVSAQGRSIQRARARLADAACMPGINRPTRHFAAVAVRDQFRQNADRNFRHGLRADVDAQRRVHPR